MAQVYFKVHTAKLLGEILCNEGTSMLRIPLNIFARLLMEVAERAREIDDDKLNLLMLRLTMYEQADPTSESYDSEILVNLEKKLEPHA